MWNNIVISKQSNVQLEINVQTAILIILYFTIKADNLESFKEVDLLQQIVSKSPLFEENSYKQDKQLILKVESYCEQHGISVLDKALNALSANLQETAFYMAVEMVFVDGKLVEEEKNFIESLSNKIGIKRDKIKAAIEIFSKIYMPNKEK